MVRISPVGGRYLKNKSAVFFHDRNGLRRIRLFRGFVHHVEDALRTCERGENRVDLHGNFVDRPAELSGIIDKNCQPAQIEAL